MKNIQIFDIEIPYWKNKRMEFTLYKMSNGVFRLGIWKIYLLGEEYGSYKGEWGFNWWKFIDIGKGKIK